MTNRVREQFDNTPSALAEAIAGDADASLSAEFRTLSHNGVRYALRLEAIFWRILELAAKTRRQRLANYVGTLLAAGAPDQNRASALRVHAAEWLSQRVVEVSVAGLAPKTLRGLANAVTAPCLIIDAANRITVSNHTFVRWARERLELDELPSGVRIAIAFSRDFETLKSAIHGSREGFVEDRMFLRTDTLTVERIGRISGLETPAGSHHGFFVTFSA